VKLPPEYRDHILQTGIPDFDWCVGDPEWAGLISNILGLNGFRHHQADWNFISSLMIIGDIHVVAAGLEGSPDSVPGYLSDSMKTALGEKLGQEVHSLQELPALVGPDDLPKLKEAAETYFTYLLQVIRTEVERERAALPATQAETGSTGQWTEAGSLEIQEARVGEYTMYRRRTLDIESGGSYFVYSFSPDLSYPMSGDEAGQWLSRANMDFSDFATRIETASIETPESVVHSEEPAPSPRTRRRANAQPTQALAAQRAPAPKAATSTTGTTWQRSRPQPRRTADITTASLTFAPGTAVALTIDRVTVDSLKLQALITDGSAAGVLDWNLDTEWHVRVPHTTVTDMIAAAVRRLQQRIAVKCTVCGPLVLLDDGTGAYDMVKSLVELAAGAKGLRIEQGKARLVTTRLGRTELQTSNTLTDGAKAKIAAAVGTPGGH